MARRRRRRERPMSLMTMLETIKEDEEFLEEVTSLNITHSSGSEEKEEDDKVTPSSGSEEKEEDDKVTHSSGSEEKEEEEEKEKNKKVRRLNRSSGAGMGKPDIRFVGSTENNYLPFNCNTCGKNYWVRDRTIIMDINSEGEEDILIDVKQPFDRFRFLCCNCWQIILILFYDFPKGSYTNKP